MLFKLNAIKTLVFRACNICCSWQYFHQEIEKLKQFFVSNNYPMWLVEKCVKQLLHRKLGDGPLVAKEKKTVKYITLPFQGHQSYNIRKSLTELLHKYFPEFTFRIIFVNSFTIGSFLKYKDRLPDHLCSDIVYLFECPDCKARYIGSTCRNLKIRISEHKG